MADRPAHHRGDGGFENPWPTHGRPGELASVLRWMAQRIGQRNVDPPARTIERVPANPPSADALGTDVAATWLGHSTTLIQCGGVTVLTDPVWARRVGPLGVAGPRRWVPPMLPIAALPPIHVVLQSHNHYDHFDAAATRAIAARNPDAVWCVPLGMKAAVARCGVTHVLELDWWGSAVPDIPRFVSGAGKASTRSSAAPISMQVTAVRVTAVPAQHFSGRGARDRNRSLWCGWVVEVGGARVYFAGDSAHHSEFAEISERLGPFDLTVIPIGAYEPRWLMSWIHMNPDEAVSVWQTIARVQGEIHHVSPPPLLCVHWGTYKLTDEPMDEPPRRIASLWEAAGLPFEALWILPHGATRRTARVHRLETARSL